MKITKDNYNELKKKELDNNFAKVWHVNDIREELLSGIRSAEGLVGDIVFQNNGEQTPNISVTTNSETNSIVLNYVPPYKEVIFKVISEEPDAVMLYSDIPDLTYTILVDQPNSILRLTPSSTFECSNIAVQITVNQTTGSIGYAELVYIDNIDTDSGIIRVGVRRGGDSASGTLTAYGLKSSIEVNIKIFGYTEI
jgi:hypothetical protein